MPSRLRKKESQMGEEGDEKYHHGMFKLNLDSVPFSVQSRQSGWSFNTKPGKDLAFWAWDRKTEVHGEDDTIQSVVLEFETLESLHSRRRLRNKKNLLAKQIRRTAEEAQSLFEIEARRAGDCSQGGGSPLRWQQLSREGHDSLLKHNGTVPEGNGPQASRERYGVEYDDLSGHSVTIA
ncbi:hypothetical protein IAR50_006890 [Cryptococcus sp. DSM 104548]